MQSESLTLCNVTQANKTTNLRDLWREERYMCL